MAGKQFLNRNFPIKVGDHTTAGTSEVTSAIVDTAGYQGVVFLTSFGTANATNTAKIQQNTANQTTGMADLTGTSITSGSSDEDIKLELKQPLERYVQLVVTRGASTTLESIWAILYNGDTSITANAVSGTAAAEAHVSPAEGTA